MVNRKSKTKIPQDLNALKSDVASFASSIGLSASVPLASSASGFDDTDFRKTGPIINTRSNRGSPNSPPKNKYLKDKTNSRTENGKPNRKFEPKRTAAFEVKTTNDNVNASKFNNLPKLPLVKAKALGVWHVDAAELEEKVIGNRVRKKVEITKLEEWKQLVEKKKELGERLLAQYVQDYESSGGQNGDIKMLMATQRSGTAADKVSAFSVMVGDNPIANLRSFDALLGMVTSKIGKRHSLTGFEVLKELLITSLLPDCKLKTLFQRPIDLLPKNKDGYSLLLFWYWEECLKQRYERFISALEDASRDVLPIVKDKALKAIYALLRSKPEQERRLLSALVNKLGDPEKKAASNAEFHLSKLLGDHPSMKAVVIDEVDNFLFRPHLGLQAKSYAVVLLSNICLSNKGDGPKIAKRLIDVYFALFKVLISEVTHGDAKTNNIKREQGKISSPKKKPAKASAESHVEMDSRLFKALLTGVNRAFPFVSSEESDEIIEAQMPILFQMVHSRSFNVAVQALMLLDKISSKNQIISDRFYRALYSKMLEPTAMNSSKEGAFFALLLRAMKNDINLKRVAAFSKRLLQVALQQPPQYACGCLFLLSEVLKARPPLWNLVLQNETMDEDLEHFRDVAEDDDDQTNAIEIRMAQAVRDTNKNGNGNGTDSDSSASQDDSTPPDSEGYDSDEANDLFMGDGQDDIKESRLIADDNKLPSEVTDVRSTFPGGYNLRHREPLYCNADQASWWELMALGSHVHPSVAAMARTLLSGANIVYNGNPLNDLSLTSFLDKFMEKKPKQSTWHGAAQIEPAKKLDMENRLIGEEILSLAESDVPAEDLVFHKFYTNKMICTKKTKKKKRKAAEEEVAEELYDINDQGDESDNEEIEDMLDSANPREADGGDYDYDDLDDIADEDDDDLIGNESDEEANVLSDPGSESEDAGISFNKDDDILGEADDNNHNLQKKRKRKPIVGASKSPFASIEEYEHLINEEDPEGKATNRNNKQPNTKAKKKRASR